MSKSYIGITIGPIFETMNLVSSPAALWTSSYMFSSVTKKLCEVLVSVYKVRAEDIISPYFDNEYTFSRKDGVGLYHDRVIFVKPDSFNIDNIRKIKETVVDSLVNTFFGDIQINGTIYSVDKEKVTTYLSEYIMIAAAEFSAEEKENISLKCGKIMDSLELAKNFVADESQNYILDRFTGKSENEGLANEKAEVKGKNDLIKKVVSEKLNQSEWQLLDKYGQIKDLPSIAKCDNTGKKYNNYCVLFRADGDNIGEIIGGLADRKDEKTGKVTSAEERTREFSKTCMKYCMEAADLVKKYGGVTIYSGGDDLLAILPCKGQIKSNESESYCDGTFIGFAENLKTCFNENFRTYIDEIKEFNKKTENSEERKRVPSLSTGAFVFYKKFPLYEAVEKSIGVLFDVAKTKKNCLAIRLQKHAGQSVELLIPNEKLGKIKELENAVFKKDGNKADDALLSAMHKITLFSSLLEAADLTEDKEKSVKNIFKNMFDAASHKDNDFVHKTLPDKYNELCDSNGISSPLKIDDKKISKPEIFSALLRLMKFFTEKGED